MPKERGNPEIARTFKALGGFADKKTDLWNAIHALRIVRGEADPVDVEPGGQPDYMVLMPPFGFFVEVKSAENNFSFSELTPKQREWLAEFCDISWLWLFMGTSINARVNPRRAWLVPWRKWLGVEARVAPHGLKGLPYDTPHRREHRDLGLSACHLLRRYALTWNGAGLWDIPERHPFWSQPHRLVRRFRPARVRRLPLVKQP
jgi:hypothetical protein